MALQVPLMRNKSQDANENGVDNVLGEANSERIWPISENVMQVYKYSTIQAAFEAQVLEPLLMFKFSEKQVTRKGLIDRAQQMKLVGVLLCGFVVATLTGPIKNNAKKSSIVSRLFLMSYLTLALWIVSVLVDLIQLTDKFISLPGQGMMIKHCDERSDNFKRKIATRTNEFSFGIIFFILLHIFETAFNWVSPIQRQWILNKESPQESAVWALVVCLGGVGWSIYKFRNVYSTDIAYTDKGHNFTSDFVDSAYIRRSEAKQVFYQQTSATESIHLQTLSELEMVDAKQDVVVEIPSVERTSQSKNDGHASLLVIDFEKVKTVDSAEKEEKGGFSGWFGGNGHKSAEKNELKTVAGSLALQTSNKIEDADPEELNDVVNQVFRNTTDTASVSILEMQRGRSDQPGTLESAEFEMLDTADPKQSTT